MACQSVFIVIFVLLSCTSGFHINKGDKPREEVADFTLHISEAGQEYNEKIEVDPDKQTELFQVPAHPGVDRSDTLHDFKKKLTMLRFPDSKMCYIFPLINEQSTPEKLIRDLKKAKQMVITETRRVDTSWIVDDEVSDRSVLSNESADFCAQYSIYHVREAQETLKVTGIQTEERANRMRRQIVRDLNGTALCPEGMDFNAASQICPDPKSKCITNRSCSRSVNCLVPWLPWLRPGRRRRRFLFGRCLNQHSVRLVTVCCEYICDSIKKSNNGTTEIFERARLL